MAKQRSDGLLSGQTRRQARLGTDAVYRVCDIGDALVEVEVISGPGLNAGQRFCFTREAVLAMELVDLPEPRR